MKKTILTAMAVVVSTGGLALNASAAAVQATTKVGNLSFALTETYQRYVYLNGAQNQFTIYGLLGGAAEPGLLNCDATTKYSTLTQTINNKTIITAIGKALGVVFTQNAQLALWNYDNAVPAPAYPPNLPDPMTLAWNGPRDYAGNLVADDVGADWRWPNLNQSDWVNYDWAEQAAWVAGGGDPLRWPQALVYISDPKNPSAALQCIEVTPFFSFEEAYCYFCWDTVDRVTSGTLTTTTEPCIGGLCSTKGNGTTKFYLTIKFNNDKTTNPWIDRGSNWPTAAPDVNSYAAELFAQGAYSLVKGFPDVPITSVIKFTVSGVVNYPWTAKAMNGITSAFGTMTMTKANGYASTPWCGTLDGNVKIVDTTDASLPVPCYGVHP